MKHFISIVCLLGGALLFWSLLAAPALTTVQATSLAQSAGEGEIIFRQKCASCHTIGGGKLVGPDLQGVTERRDYSWLQRLISDPGALFASGDPEAQQLLEEYNNIVMPNLGLTEQQVNAVLAFLEAQSSTGQVTAPVEVNLPQGSALAGQKLFTGETRLMNGGPACIACHTAPGAGFLQGGSLGPDLTHVIQRYGEAGLASNLDQINFPPMVGSFQNRPLTAQEQADLIAYFQWSDTQASTPASSRTSLMFGLGAGGALILFGMMAIFWPLQRESLSSRLRKSSNQDKTKTDAHLGSPAH
ncbi:MAG: cytochrome c [Chloroflexi bacterium]|nr:cytochrome c [Chloroflexota bacterium]